MWDEPVNRAIDETARRMTEGPPPVEFRRRVLARIEAGDAPRRSGRALFVLLPIAAAAAIVIAVVALHRPPPTDAIAGRAEHARPRGEPTETSASASGRAVVGAELAPPETRPRREPARAAAPVGAELAPPAVQPPIDPLDVAPLTVSALAPDPIQIEQLETLAPMTIAPLDITDRQRRDP
jgi:hypothetical protein